MKTTTRILIACLLALIGSVANAQTTDRTLTALRQRTTDRAIAADLARIAAWRTRLDAVSARPGRPHDIYRETLAGAWLATAMNEYQDNDRTLFPSAALTRAAGLIQQMEGGVMKPRPGELPTSESVKGTVPVHPELWSTLETLKQHEGFECAAEALARMEVELQTAGNEQLDQGDCNTSPHLAAAESWARDARLKAEACAAKPVAVVTPPVPTPAPLAPTEPVVAPPPSIPTAEELRIPRDVHFALDKHFISPQSHAVIEGIVAILKKYPSITVRLEGHTDSRASVAYNLALSKRRVNATNAVFLKLGIDPKRITTTFKGKGELTAEENSKKGFALNRRVEMVFVDAEGRDIVGERQEGDLQLESGRKPKR